MNECGCPFREVKKQRQQVVGVPDEHDVDLMDYWFDAFWTLYPRKVAKHKALLAFRALAPSREVFTAIFTDVERRAGEPDWTKNNGMYIPYPTTYLHGRRWEDEQPKPVDNSERLIY